MYYLCYTNMKDMNNTIITPEFIKALATEVKASGGSWVDMSNCPTSPIGYSVTPYDNGDVIVKFDAVVSDGSYSSRRWKVYPISKRKPEGMMSALRA